MAEEIKKVKVESLYDLKDLVARAHIADFNNPHRVSYKQVGFTQLEKYYKDGEIDLAQYIKDTYDLDTLLKLLLGEDSEYIVYDKKTGDVISPFPDTLKKVDEHDKSFNSINTRMSEIELMFDDIQKVVDAVNGDDGEQEVIG